MLEQLHYVLAPRVSHEYAELIRHGFDVLNRLGFTNYEYELSAIINTVDQLDADSFVMGVVGVLDSGLNVVLREHEVTFEFTDEDLEPKIEAALAMVTLSEFNNPDAVLAHTDCEDLSNEEIIACVLGEATDYDDTFWLLKVVDVTPGFIATLSDRMHTLKERDEWAESTDEDLHDERKVIKDRARQRARQFRDATKAHPLYAMQLITEGATTGRPLSRYIDPIRDELIELKNSDADLAAQNILFAVLLSDVDDGDVLSSAQHVCEDIYGVARMQALVHGQLNDQYQKVEPNGDA